MRLVNINDLEMPKIAVTILRGEKEFELMITPLTSAQYQKLTLKYPEPPAPKIDGKYDYQEAEYVAAVTAILRERSLATVVEMIGIEWFGVKTVEEAMAITADKFYERDLTQILRAGTMVAQLTDEDIARAREKIAPLESGQANPSEG